METKFLDLKMMIPLYLENVTPRWLILCQWSLESLSLTWKFCSHGDKQIYILTLKKDAEQKDLTISLKSVVCKIFEGIIEDELMTFFLINYLIATQQHGFVPRNGSVSSLLEILNFVTEAFSWGDYVDKVMLDFSKALISSLTMVWFTNLKDTVLGLNY